MTSTDDGFSIISLHRKPCNDRVRINVSGTMFETLEETLSRFPETLLGCPSKRVEYFDARHKEYFFNRNRLAFDAILFYYQSYGRLVRPDVVPENVFIEEVRFFEIRSDYTSTRDKIERALLGKEEDLPHNFIQRKIWLLFSHPESSYAAKMLAILSVVIILLSVAIPCFESSGDLAANNNTAAFFSSLEMACYVWFTFELVVRFASAPDKLGFFRSMLNIVDIISVFPYYVLLTMQGTRAPLSVLRTARMLRILRIFKLSRYSSGMRILLFTFSTSMKELGMFLIFISISVLVSSSAAFYAEVDCGKKVCAFVSIPDAFWWAVNTVTTVGYGDQYPLTATGKMVGGLLTVFGVLIIALPVFLFVANFNKVMNANMAAINKRGKSQLK